MKVQTETLLAELIEYTRQHINQVEQLKQQSEAELNWKANTNSWSALEAIEHLNLYGDFYLPEIAKRISESKHQAEAQFKAGFLGNYFANMMLPRAKPNNMKTFSDKNPNGSKLDSQVLDRFLEQQHRMLELLKQARQVSLTKTKTGITISSWIKLRLGDTFRVVIYHNERHVQQAYRVLKAQSTQKEAAIN